MEYFESPKSHHISGHEPSNRHPGITMQVVLLFQIHRVPMQPDNYKIFKQVQVMSASWTIFGGS
jgi:hypothetical protein